MGPPMQIQSLSVDIPTKTCPNKCPYCVSRMHTSPYENLITGDFSHQGRHERDYIRRMAFARDNGCNTAILTGTGEPLTNRAFLDKFAKLNWALPSPFRWVELQTSGIYLTEDMLDFLNDTIGVTTISLSVASFDSNDNAHLMRMPQSVGVALQALACNIKMRNMNLRFCLNMTSAFNNMSPAALFEVLRSFQVDQVTFRRLYVSDKGTKQEKWISSHRYTRWKELEEYIMKKGRRLERLPFGAIRYSVDGISTLIDDDCMSAEAKLAVKYLVLRPNCKLYTKWDDPGSLLF